MDIAFPFVKMESVGNDFVLVEESTLGNVCWPSLALRLCDRHRGVGADGLLVLGPSSRADFRMRMFNPDGTEDHCGNGLRCSVVHWVQSVTEDRRVRVSVESLGGTVANRVIAGPGGFLVETDMGPPRFSPADLPMTVNAERVVDWPLEVEGVPILVTVVSTGTTHTVIFATAEEIAARFDRLSPLIERHPLFPQRTSVLWTEVVARDRLRLRIWERGAKETLGCGTGACAAMVAARIHGRVDDRCAVESRGGILHVEWWGEGECRLTGTARTAYRGMWTGGALELREEGAG